MWRQRCCCGCQFPDFAMAVPGVNIDHQEWSTDEASVTSIFEQVTDQGSTITCKGVLDKPQQPPCLRAAGSQVSNGTSIFGSVYQFVRIYEDFFWQPNGDICLLDLRMDTKTSTGVVVAIRQGGQYAYNLFTTGDPRIQFLGPDGSDWRRTTITGLNVGNPTIPFGFSTSGRWNAMPNNDSYGYIPFTVDTSPGAPPVYFGFTLGRGTVSQGGSFSWEFFCDSLCMAITVSG